MTEQPDFISTWASKHNISPSQALDMIYSLERLIKANGADSTQKLLQEVVEGNYYLTLNSYQRLARRTALPHIDNDLQYAALGVANEGGEVAGVVKKIIRDEDISLLTAQNISDIEKELGDVLWYAAQTASVIGTPLSKIAEANLNKVDSRKTRGKIGGSGEDR